MADYTNTPPTSQVTRQVAIASVDAVGQGAHGYSNVGTLLYIDTSYYVGAVSVTPTVGDQWVVKLINGQWRLDHRIPFNDPNQAAIIPTQGQHIVGSGQGPIELQGTQVNVAGPLSIASYSSNTLPDATMVPPGTHVYDTTLGKPVWSNGVNWTDSSGNITIAQVTAHLHGGGAVRAVDAPKELPRLSGAGRLKATVGYLGRFSGRGALSVSDYPEFGRIVPFSGRGILSGPNYEKAFSAAGFSGRGSPSASTKIVPRFDSVGGGSYLSGGSGTISWTHNISSSSTILFVAVSNVTNHTSQSASCGSTAMTGISLVSGSEYLYGYSYPLYSAIDIFYLINPPTGTQTIRYTSDNTNYCAANSISYTNCSGFGASSVHPAMATGSTASISATAPVGQVILNVLGYWWTGGPSSPFSGYTQTARYISTPATSGEPLLIGEAAGSGSAETFSASLTYPNNYWGAVAIPLVPQ